MSLLATKIESLPALSDTIIRLEEFRKKQNKELEDLVAIVERDPFVVANILKLVNSSMFGFRTKVETIAKAVNLLGMNYTFTLAFGSAIQNSFKTDMKSAYGVNIENFMGYGSLMTTILNEWVAGNIELKNELFLPVFLQDIGKIIVSDIIITNNKHENFRKLVTDENVSIEYVEKRVVGVSSSQITANMFKHWKLSQDLIDVIEHVDDLENCSPELFNKTLILKIIKTACRLTDILSEKSIVDACELSKKYNKDDVSLSKILNKHRKLNKEEKI